jgi:hypothetical protein
MSFHAKEKGIKNKTPNFTFVGVKLGAYFATY